VSDPRIALLLEIYDRFVQRDWDSVFRLLDDDFTWTFDPNGFLSGTYSGAVAIRKAIEEFTEVFKEFRVEIEELLELDPEHIAIACRLSGRGEASDVPIELSETVVWTIRDGAVVEAQEHLGRPAEVRTILEREFPHVRPIAAI
jgi:ketosteroid isomerase-like protein